MSIDTEFLEVFILCAVIYIIISFAAGIEAHQYGDIIANCGQHIAHPESLWDTLLGGV